MHSKEKFHLVWENFFNVLTYEYSKYNCWEYVIKQESVNRKDESETCKAEVASPLPNVKIRLEGRFNFICHLNHAGDKEHKQL